MTHRVTAVGDQTSLADRKRRAGQRLFIGFEHPHVDDDLRYLVKQIQPAGFVLFARNVDEPEQVRELNRELASLVDPAFPAILSVDQEGGRVQRIREPATRWPAMRTVGRVGDQTLEVSRGLARELRAMRFDLNFAPVADVDSNPDNPVIGDRSFARDPQEVAQHVATFIQGHHEVGVITCAKHFPGHGDTKVDSHLDLPVVEEELPRLLTRELVPFAAAVRAGVGTIMTSHVVFPALDEELPATLSPRVIPQLLRQRLGFDGLVLSDDMEMKAVHGRWDTATSALLATRATVDVFLCCRDPKLQVEMFQSLVRLQETHPDVEKRSIDTMKRLRATRERFFLDRQPPTPWREVDVSTHRVTAELVRVRGA
jgi:beta-N-acetylhexosaminidase